jgi:RimJ/RimL family protein N-acetyltransferase
MSSSITVRSLHAGDEDALADLFRRMSPESRRLRYFSPKPRLTERELTRLVGVDHVRHEAIAALDEADRMIAVARYAQTETAGTVEVAFEVADEHQREGHGRALLERIMCTAYRRGYTRFVATVLWENCAARSLLRSLGFRARSVSDGVVDLYANGLAAMKKTATSTSTPSTISAVM